MAEAWSWLPAVAGLAVLTAFVLSVAGHLPRSATADALMLAGFFAAGVGWAVQGVVDYFAGPKDGSMFVRFTGTGWRLAGPVWTSGIIAFAAGAVLQVLDL